MLNRSGVRVNYVLKMIHKKDTGAIDIQRKQRMVDINRLRHKEYQCESVGALIRVL